MPNYKIEFFGWCYDPANKNDKVWGYVSVGEFDSVLYNFWGARGKKYTFKKYDKPQSRWDQNTLAELACEKMKPGRKSGTYRRIDPSEVMTVVPNFEEEFVHQLAVAKLFDKFHGESSNE